MNPTAYPNTLFTTMTSKSDTHTSRGWSASTPSLTERTTAFLNGVFSGRFDHQIKSTIGAKPTTSPLDDHEIIQLDLYKVWYVLHYNEIGEDRTTNLRVKKIGSTQTTPEHMSESNICAMVLPLEYQEWAATHPAVDLAGEHDD